MTSEAYVGFLAAARSSVGELHRMHGFDLWLVTCLDADPRPPHVSALLTAAGTDPQAPMQSVEDQVVLAAAGPFAANVPTGARLPFAVSLCRPMSAGAPWYAPDVSEVPAYAEVLDGLRDRGLGGVRAYLGRPLVRVDGTVFGTVCGYGMGTPAGRAPEAVEHLHLVAELLSAVFAAEERAAERSREAAHALELAEHDVLTGLRNRRGWDNAVALEQQRVARYGHPACVLVLDLDDLKGANDTHGHAHGDRQLQLLADTLRRLCRPSDVVARTGGDEFAVLAVEADILAGRALAARAADHLRRAGIRASVGVAARRTGEDLTATTERADAEMNRVKRRRQAIRRR